MKLGARKNPPGAETKQGPQEQSASWSNGPMETGSNQFQRSTNQEGRKERTRRCQIDQMKLRDQAGSRSQAGLQFGWAEHNKSQPVRPALRCPVGVSNQEMMDPGNLPSFPKDPQSGSRFGNWAYVVNTGTRWTAKSVSWVERSLHSWKGSRGTLSCQRIKRMSFDEDVALHEPLVQEELQGADGGQEVALQGPQPSCWRLNRTPVDPALEPPAIGSAGSQWAIRICTHCCQTAAPVQPPFEFSGAPCRIEIWSSVACTPLMPINP